MRGKIGQRRGYFSAAAVYGVQVPLSGSGRGVAELLHQVLECRASGGGQGPPSVAQIMEPEAWHTDLAACAGEGLPDGVATHGLAVRD